MAREAAGPVGKYDGQRPLRSRVGRGCQPTVVPETATSLVLRAQAPLARPGGPALCAPTRVLGRPVAMTAGDTARTRLGRLVVGQLLPWIVAKRLVESRSCPDYRPAYR